MGSTDGTMRGLAGRKAELEALGRALAEASAGKGRAVIVTGEPGIGKTGWWMSSSAMPRAPGY